MVDKVGLSRPRRRALPADSPHVSLLLVLACLLLWPQASFGGGFDVESIVPSSAAAGTTVTITLGGFVPGAVTAVSFGGVPATTFTTGNPFTVTVPNGFSGSVVVVVTAGGGTSQPNRPSNLFTLLAPPAISTPALSQWSMILLTLLLACFGGFALRRKFA
jgi:hypothetical protein